jgi:hypothetical protein
MMVGRYPLGRVRDALHGLLRARVRGVDETPEGDGDCGASLHFGRAPSHQVFRARLPVSEKAEGVLFWTGEQILEWYEKNRSAAPAAASR